MLTGPVVCLDSGRRSCIVVRVTPKKVFFIAMADMQIADASHDKFLSRFKPTNYPLGQAASHYLAAAEYLDISAATRKQLTQLKAPGKPELMTGEAAQAILAKVSIIDLNGDVISPVITSTVPDNTGDAKEHQMATAKKPAAEKKAATKPAAGKKAATKPATEKKATVKKEVPQKTEKQGRKPGVGSLVIDALLAGKDTSEILMSISEAFPDSTANASTVSWYRSKLKKEGKL